MSEQRDKPDDPMTATYIRVILLEVAILIALWILGRMYS
jgi:hypothetical protein